MKRAAILALPLLLAGCAEGPRARGPGLHSMVTEPAWPSVAACLAATHAAFPGSREAYASCVRIDLENALSPVFVLQAVVIEVDGARLYAREEPRHERGELDLVSTFTAGLGQMAPGTHEVRLAAWLLPNALVEPSLSGYRWQVCAKHLFTVAPGAGLSLSAQLYENRAEPRPPEQWLAARYLENGVEPAQHLEPMSPGAPDLGCPRVDPR